MKQCLITLLSVSTVILTLFAPAAEARVDEYGDYELEPLFKDKVWDMSAELGILLTSGNTDSSSFIAKLDAKHEWEKWRFQYNFNALYKKDEQYDEDVQAEVLQTTAEQYIFKAQTDFEITETDAVFGFLSHTDDRFASYVTYSTIVAGYSFRAINEEKRVLDFNIGPGYAKGRTSEDENEQGVIIRGSAAFNWEITDYARFVQNVSVETAGFNTRTIAESSFTTQVSGSMQMKVGFKAIHDTQVDEEQEKLSTETSLTLVMII